MALSIEFYEGLKQRLEPYFEEKSSRPQAGEWLAEQYGVARESGITYVSTFFSTTPGNRARNSDVTMAHRLTLLCGYLGLTGEDELVKYAANGFGEAFNFPPRKVTPENSSSDDEPETRGWTPNPDCDRRISPLLERRLSRSDPDSVEFVFLLDLKRKMVN